MNCSIPTTMHDNEKKSPLVAVLAAGNATRFGGGKLDADLAGKALGQWSLLAVADAGLEPGVIVTGPVPPHFAHREQSWTKITNHAPDRGIGFSIALAAREALMRGQDLLVLLADMPLVQGGFLREIAAQNSLAACAYSEGLGESENEGEKPGVPALFPHDKLGALINLDGDQGAGKLLQNMAEVALLTPPENMLRDVDIADDLAEIEALLSGK